MAQTFHTKNPTREETYEWAILRGGETFYSRYLLVLAREAGPHLEVKKGTFVDLRNFFDLFEINMQAIAAVISKS